MTRLGIGGVPGAPAVRARRHDAPAPPWEFPSGSRLRGFEFCRIRRLEDAAIDFAFFDATLDHIPTRSAPAGATLTPHEFSQTLHGSQPNSLDLVGRETAVSPSGRCCGMGSAAAIWHRTRYLERTGLGSDCDLKLL